MIIFLIDMVNDKSAVKEEMLSTPHIQEDKNKTFLFTFIMMLLLLLASY